MVLTAGTYNSNSKQSKEANISLYNSTTPVSHSLVFYTSNKKNVLVSKNKKWKNVIINSNFGFVSHFFFLFNDESSYTHSSLLKCSSGSAFALNTTGIIMFYMYFYMINSNSILLLLFVVIRGHKFSSFWSYGIVFVMSFEEGRPALLTWTLKWLMNQANSGNGRPCELESLAKVT